MNTHQLLWIERTDDPELPWEVTYSTFRGHLRTYRTVGISFTHVLRKAQRPMRAMNHYSAEVQYANRTLVIPNTHTTAKVGVYA